MIVGEYKMNITEDDIGEHLCILQFENCQNNKKAKLKITKRMNENGKYFQYMFNETIKKIQ